MVSNTTVGLWSCYYLFLRKDNPWNNQHVNIKVIREHQKALMELKASVHSGAHEGKEQLEAELALMEKELERNEVELTRLREIVAQHAVPPAPEVMAQVAAAPDTAEPVTMIRENDSHGTAIQNSAVQATSYTRNRHKPNVDWQVTEEPNRPRERRKEHDELTAELVHMARRLKTNNLTLRDLVESDRKVVDKADLALGVNAGRFKNQHRDLQSFSSKSWATTWKLILLTVFVLISLLLTFMLIVVTKSS